jgi:hypothetical protein
MPEYRLITEFSPGNRETQMVELPEPPKPGQRVDIDGREWVVENLDMIFEDGEWRPSVDQAWVCKPA